MVFSRPRYHPAIVILHWLMFLLFVIALTAIEVRGYIPKGTPLRANITQIHMMAGQLVLLLAAVRLFFRIRKPVPAPVPGPAWQQWLSKLLHLVLYLVMFALPLAGIIFVQAGGREVSFFGLTLPHLVGSNADLREPVKAFHEFVGNAVYYLVGFHILAALWHQFGLKDNILNRMRLR